MNEILQKRIEEAAENIVEDYNHYQFLNDGTKDVYTQSAVLFMLNEMAQFILNNQWISVEEELPTLDEKYDFSERYLVKTNEGAIKVMRIFKNIAWCDIFDGRAFIPFEKKIVTHWMSIPSLEGGEK